MLKGNKLNTNLRNRVQNKVSDKFNVVLKKRNLVMAYLIKLWQLLYIYYALKAKTSYLFYMIRLIVNIQVYSAHKTKNILCLIKPQNTAICKTS